MSTYSDFEQVWLIKSSGNILGPFSFIELTQAIRDRRFAVLDEVRSPTTRWGYIREQTEFTDVVKQVREYESQMNQDTADTATLSLTKSITKDSMRDELTPAPELTPTPTDQAPTQPIKPWTFQPPSKSTSPTSPPSLTFQVDAKPDRTRLTILLTILFCVTVFAFYLNNQRRAPQTLSAKELLSFARLYRGMGLYKKSMNFYNRVLQVNKSDTETLREAIPLMLATNTDPLTIRDIINDFEFRKTKDPSLARDIYYGKGMLSMKEGKYKEALNEFSALEKLSPEDKSVIVNRQLALYFSGNYLDVVKNVMELKKRGLNHPYLQIVQVLSLLRQETLADEKIVKSIIEDLYKKINLQRQYQLENLFLLAALQLRTSQVAEYPMTLRKIFEFNPDETSLFVHDLEIDNQILDWKNFAPACQFFEKNINDHILNHQVKVFCSLKTGDYENTLQLIETVNRLTKGEASLSGIYSVTLKKQMKFSEAKVSTSVGSSKLARLVRSELCLQEKDIDCAENYLRLVLESDPQNPVALVGMVKLHILKNNKEAAKQEITNSLYKFNDFIPLIEMKEEIVGQ